MRQSINGPRLCLEIIAVIALVESLIMLVLPLIAPGMNATVDAMLDASLLSLIAGPAIFWRVRAAIRRTKQGCDFFVVKMSAKLVVITASILLVGLLFTGWMVMDKMTQTLSQARAQFDRSTERTTREIQRSVNQPVYGMMGARGVYAASRSVDRGEFARYVGSRNLPVEFPGAIGFGFIERVLRKDLDAFVAAERADGAPEFSVHSYPKLGAEVQMLPDLYVIKHIYPRERNLPAWGLDIGSEPVRRAAAEQAIRTSKPTISGRVNLVQGAGRQTGFLYFLPVYRNGAKTTTEEERNASLVGLIYAPIVLKEAMEMIAESAENDLRYAVYDGNEIDQHSLLFDQVEEENLKNATPRNGEEASQPVDSAWFTSRTAIMVGGRTWTIVSRSTPKFEASISYSVPVMIGIAGTLLSLLFASIIWSLAISHAHAVALATEMTTDLASAKAAAESANSAKSLFLANMSHEIRTPMTAIIGYVDMLTDPDMPPALRESHAQTIKRSGRHLLSIINNILDISKIESGQMTVESIDCPVRSTVEDAVMLLQGLAAKKGLAINVAFEPGVPEQIQSDPMRLREVLVNLIGNAIKYTEQGEIAITVSTGSGIGGQPSLFVSVKDTGVGLTSEQAASLFVAFKQADNSHTRRFGGTGLGLVISKHFAELLGGTITVQSVSGVGSTFTVSVAMNAAPRTPVKKEERPRHSTPRVREPAEIVTTQQV